MATSVGKVLGVGVLGAVIGAAATYLVMAGARSSSAPETEPVSAATPVGGTRDALAPEVPAAAARMEGGAPGGSPAKREHTRAIAKLLEEAKVALPAPVPGKITGTVRTGDGRPVAGVVIRAWTHLPEQQWHRRGVVPQDRSPEDRAWQGVRAAKWAAETNREALTDGSGAYVLENLFDMEYYVVAYADGYELQTATNSWAKARPGGSLDWFARALVPVPLVVLGPDGKPADEAYLRWDSKNGRAGGDTWRRGDLHVLMEPGEWSVQATVGEEMRSPSVRVTAGTTSETTTLRLETRNRLQGTVRLDPADSAWEHVLVTLRRRDGGAVEGGRTHVQAPTWSFRFQDLEPGDYELSAGISDANAVTTSSVRVTSGTATQDLVLPRLAATHVLEVRVVGTGGEPPKADEVQFAFYERQAESGARGAGTTHTQRSDGVFLVALKSPWAEHRERAREDRTRGAVAGGPPLPPDDADPKGHFRTSVRVQLKAGGYKEAEFVPGETTRVEVSFR